MEWDGLPPGVRGNRRSAGKRSGRSVESGVAAIRQDARESLDYSVRTYHTNAGITCLQRTATLPDGVRVRGSHCVTIGEPGEIRITFYPAGGDLWREEFEQLRDAIPFAFREECRPRTDTGHILSSGIDLCHEEFEQLRDAIPFEAGKLPNAPATRVPNQWYCRWEGAWRRGRLWQWGLRIPDHSDHRFRFIPITDSDGFRSVIPIHCDHC